MKKVLKNLIALFIIISILMYNTRILAASLNELVQEQNTVNDKISETKEELEEIVEAKTETLKQVEKLISQISSYQKEVDELNEKISDLKKRIAEAEKNIKEDEQKYQEQQEAMNKRLAIMYRNRNTSYLEYLLSSSNIMDFISSYYLISKMSDYDEKMLEEVKQHKEKIEKEKEQLENDKKEVEKSQTTLESKKKALEVVKKSKENYADKLSDEEKEAEKKIQELQDANDDLDKKIKKAKEEIEAAKAAAARAAQNRATNSNSGAPSGEASSYGLIWPTLTKFNTISAGWYYSSGKLHGGTDITGSGILGTPIYAVADGYVITSEARVDGNGNYVSYGNVVMIAHYNGLYTLYGHMQKRAVSTGQTVTQGQVIGYVGSTGNSTGPHLHFEVRTGNGTYAERVNPIYYLPSV